LTVLSAEEYQCYQLHKKIPGIINVEFDVPDQLLITYSVFVRY